MAVKELVEQCKAELTEEGRKFNENIEVGIMVETPAASLLADRLAEVADFFSIGTNDLIGYTMCADRGNDTISNLYQVYYPAVLRSLKNIIESGVKAGIMVGMCGEAAADPLLEPLLIELGPGGVLDERSVDPARPQDHQPVDQGRVRRARREGARLQHRRRGQGTARVRSSLIWYQR